MNVEILDEARVDIANGVAFYDRQNYGAGDYLFERIFDDINKLADTAGQQNDRDSGQLTPALAHHLALRWPRLHGRAIP